MWPGLAWLRSGLGWLRSSLDWLGCLRSSLNRLRSSLERLRSWLERLLDDSLWDLLRLCWDDPLRDLGRLRLCRSWDSLRLRLSRGGRRNA